MKKIVRCVVIAGGISSPALAQTTINGDNMALQSSGAASGSGWTLSENGYVGTYISLTSPAAVTFTANAMGAASNGVNPDMTFSIANSTDSFSVTAGSNNYTYTTPTLPAGTYFVRSQLDNQDPQTSTTPDLTINSFTVSGSGVSVLNSNTDTNALTAATDYAQNYRQGPATISLTNGNGNPLGAGTQVQVKLVDNTTFNFAAAVYGQSPYSSPAQWLNDGSNNGPTNSAPNTTEEIDYQNAVLSNFNMIVPSNGGKWQNNESTEGSPYMQMVDAMSDFAHQHGLSMRMHNLIWNSQQPTYINNLFNSNGTISAANKTTLLNDITSRINYYVSENSQSSGLTSTPRADLYEEMDVLNEAWHGQSAQDNYLGALGYQGVANIYAQVANAVKAAGANTRLYTNEYNVLQFSPASISSTGVASGTDNYANWYLQGIQQLQNDGGPVSGIGMEMYVNASNPVSPSEMQEAMQNLSVDKTANGSPVDLSLTEFGNATGQSPTASVYDTDLTDALTMIYGTPQATTFGYWGGIGGPNQSNGIYALYNSSYQLTSAGTTFQTWMNQWNTNDTLTTNANGQVSFNGTYGIYDVTVDGIVYELDLIPGTTNYGLLTPISGVTWNGGGGAGNVNWSDTANWTGTLTANAPIVFAGTTSLAPNNDSAAGTEYNSITFNSGSGPFVIGGNAITLGGNIVNNSANTQTINLPIAIQQNTTFNAASGNLTLGGAISGGYSITTSGPNTVTLAAANSYTGATTISAGMLVIAAAGALPSGSNVSIASGAALVVNGNITSGTITGNGALTVGNNSSNTTLQLGTNTGQSAVNSLTIASGSALDVTNNSLIINYGSGGDPNTTILGYLSTGANSGAWNGPGIMSSTAASNSNYGVGYSDGADGIDPSLTSGQIEVAYVQYGDITMQGVVNAQDFQILTSNFGYPTTAGWEAGDFLYQGVVNAEDFFLMASNFGLTETGEDLGISADDKAALIAFADANDLSVPANVPEPVGLLGLAAIGTLAVRRRRRPATQLAKICSLDQ